MRRRELNKHTNHARLTDSAPTQRLKSAHFSRDCSFGPIMFVNSYSWVCLDGEFDKHTLLSYAHCATG